MISSSASCLPEVGGNAALYFDPHDYTLLAQHMLNIATDKSLADDLRQKGFEQAKNFTTEKHAASIMNVYQSVL